MRNFALILGAVALLAGGMLLGRSPMGQRLLGTAPAPAPAPAPPPVIIAAPPPPPEIIDQVARPEGTARMGDGTLVPLSPAPPTGTPAGLLARAQTATGEDQHGKLRDAQLLLWQQKARGLLALLPASATGFALREAQTMVQPGPMGLALLTLLYTRDDQAINVTMRLLDPAEAKALAAGEAKAAAGEALNAGQQEFPDESPAEMAAEAPAEPPPATGIPDGLYGVTGPEGNPLFLGRLHGRLEVSVSGTGGVDAQALTGFVEALGLGALPAFTAEPPVPAGGRAETITAAAEAADAGHADDAFELLMALPAAPEGDAPPQ